MNKEARLLKSYQYANGAWGTELPAGAAAKNLSKVLKNAKAENNNTGIIRFGRKK